MSASPTPPSAPEWSTSPSTVSKLRKVTDLTLVRLHTKSRRLSTRSETGARTYGSGRNVSASHGQSRGSATKRCLSCAVARHTRPQGRNTPSSEHYGPDAAVRPCCQSGNQGKTEGQPLSAHHPQPSQPTTTSPTRTITPRVMPKTREGKSTISAIQ